MKVKNYEKNELVIFIIINLLIIEIITILFLINYKVYEYKKITGIISNKNIITLVVDKEEKKLLRNNKKLYLDNSLLEYRIIEDKGYIVKKNDKKYYEILIFIKTPKNKKISDYIEISIKTKKISLIKLLKKIEEGG